MNQIIENFRDILEDQNMNLTEKELQNNQVLFTGGFRLQENQQIPFGIVFDASDQETVDYQVMYNRIGYLNNRDKKPELLDYLNEINQMKAGYYSFTVRDDGEIYLRTLGRTGQDVKAAYEVMIYGGSIAQALMPELNELLEELNN